MTTIAYDRPMKDLIAGLNATGHVTHRSYVKKSVTLHHNAGRLSHEGVLQVWRSRPASAHFDIDGAGAACQYVNVNEYAWAAGNTQGNIESIHIEMANSTLAPEWGVSSTTWQAAARLAGWLFAKVIKARPSAGNFFVHSHWYATACAGPSIAKVWNQIMSAAQAAYDYFTKPAAAPAPGKVKPSAPANVPGAKYTGPRQIKIADVKPNNRNEAVRRFNGLLWSWLCVHGPAYAYRNTVAWGKESSNFFGPQAQRATQEMYRILTVEHPGKFSPVTLPTWPGHDAVLAIGGTPTN